MADESNEGSRRDVTNGIRAAVVAYGVWGLLTIYWKQLAAFNAFELIGWRIVTASGVMIVIITGGRRWPVIRAVFADRRLTMRIAAASVLLTANWSAYVYAVVNGRVLETALGYFMAPLGTMALGIIVFKERPTRSQKWAVVLAAVAVVVLTVSYGRPPVVALTIAVTWSFYGLLKRQVPLSAVESLAAETLVLLVPALAVAIAMAGRIDSIPRSADPRELALVSLAGVATVVPLTLFAFAAPRVPFTILGPLNYLVPTINFLLGWVLYDENMPWSRLLGFVVVWIALAMVTIDRLRTSAGERRDAPGGRTIGTDPKAATAD